MCKAWDERIQEITDQITKQVTEQATEKSDRRTIKKLSKIMSVKEIAEALDFEVPYVQRLLNS